MGVDTADAGSEYFGSRFRLVCIESQKYYVTDHADEESQADRLSSEDVFQSVRNGEVIEDYPTDYPYPSCLIHGLNSRGAPIHSVWAYNEANKWQY